MKKLLTFMIVWTCLLTLAGCGKKDMDYTMQNESSVAESVRETGEESVLIQNEDAGEGENAAPETKYITIDLSRLGDSPKEIAVTGGKLCRKENGIDFCRTEWYESKQLSLPMVGKEWNNFYDDEYQYIWSGDALYIYENISGNCLYVLEYPTDKWYINGNNACLLDDIFYGISVTNGYAQPDSCFMFAYDLENNKLLWRSGDQTCNTMNFIVKKDVIICGYGFTSEKDYLYQLNLHTGEVIASLELKKQPDLLVPQDNMLYVHTYSYNYTIEMQ